MPYRNIIFDANAFVRKTADAQASVRYPVEVQSVRCLSRLPVIPQQDTEISGAPPLSFRARSGMLSGYKLYGNLRHEESPNLIIDWLSNINSVSRNTASLSKTSTSITITSPDNQAFAGNWTGSDSKVTVKPSTIYRLSWAYTGQGKSQVGISFNCTANSVDSWLSPWTRLDSGSVTFTTPSGCSNIGIRFETGPEDDISTGIATISQLMLEENPSGAVNYRPYGGQILAVGDLVTTGTYAGKYKIPVTISGESTSTTDIYLNAPLRKVGAYADYIDYERQKVCRVIKTVTSDGSHWNSYQQNNQYDINCGHLMNRLPLVNDNAVMTESSLYPGASAVDEWANRSTTDYKCIAVNDTYYEFLVVDNVSFPDRNLQTFQNLLQQLDTAGNPFEIWYINSDSENVSDPPAAAVYEEESITLPALSTEGGVNLLSVGTAVQPSQVWIKGKIQVIE